MKTRGYQPNFYHLSEGVRDLRGRQKKARKIARLLQAYSKVSLRELICLDIGCSSGFITAELADLFTQTIGIEYDDFALHQARQLSKSGLTFLKGDAMDLPVAPNSIDVIICAQVYEHVPNDEKLIREIYRILKPGGIVFFSGPNWLFPIEPHYFIPFLHWLPETWADKLLQLLGKSSHYYERSRTWWGLQKLFRQFKIMDCSVEILQDELSQRLPTWVINPASRLPSEFWKWVAVWLPNFNWILEKPQ